MNAWSMNGVLKRIHLVHNSVRSKRFYGNIYQEVRPPPQCSKNKNVELKFSANKVILEWPSWDSLKSKDWK